MPQESSLPKLDPTLMPNSPEYAKQRMDLYQRETQPGFTSGQRALRSYIRSSRGLGDSGIEGALIGQSFQDRNQDIGDEARRVNLEQAGMNEHQRQLQQQRDWQLQDYQRALEEQKRQEGLAADQRSQAMVGDILQSTGTLVGSYYGGPAGGAAGGAAGRAAGGGEQSPKPRSNPYRAGNPAQSAEGIPGDDGYDSSQIAY